MDVGRSERLDEAEAIRLVRKGDPRGAEALLERHQKEVYNVALRMLGEPAAAEDAAQDAFLRAFTRLDLYREGEPFGAWLHGIVRNRCLDILRSRSRASAVYPLVAPQQPDAERDAIRNLEAQGVRRALSRLPTRDRALLVLRYWEDRPMEEVAQSLGMTDGAARVALHRARRSLAGQLSTMEITS
jgi:RNA polymerase sigma-70 factor (ECF subfamily)